MRVAISIILIGVLLSGCAWPTSESATSQDPSSTLGSNQQSQPIFRIANEPIFHLKAYSAESLLGGENILIGGQQDKITVLNVWASWCAPCLEEAPELRAFYQSMPDRVQLIGINASKYDDRDEVLDFVDRYDLRFPHVWDGKGELTKQLRAISYPTTVIVNLKGEIVWLHAGPITAKQLKDLIAQVN